MANGIEDLSSVPAPNQSVIDTVIDIAAPSVTRIANDLGIPINDSDTKRIVKDGVVGGDSRVVLDISGRPGLKLNVEFTRARIGDFDVDLIHEFFQGFINHANITLHIDNLRGDNAHHQSETIFKAFGRALRFAVEIDEKIKGEMPSTKGSL